MTDHEKIVAKYKELNERYEVLQTISDIESERFNRIQGKTRIKGRVINCGQPRQL